MICASEQVVVLIKKFIKTLLMNLKHIKHTLLKDELQRLENAIMNEQNRY